ncbi:FMN-binding negative transcriptional regulator [Lentiprolixibacter aurantiacus]|uniref:FMN-binding negative transcriptional regulator n=1 Tax=Lentiprolixibacter aurantiacus TaxID=2993939 RepID=A0AAE3SP36_9FLAO|nr:FMN-binding negative transcriptional regulator [Lentiprolixibacter aurantiacus]MCX2720284.1 FMN-binding negative transcriptional regulator [Lentiprolixibacter aurantiacus]
MYIPLQYRNENLEEVKDFLRDNAFAILVSQVDNRPWATHLPLELETTPKGKQVLTGHMARRNPQWKHFQPDTQVLAIFNGPHAYISSSWYQDEEVPTWNYVAVHIYGTLRILKEEEVMASLHRLVDKYEAQSKHPVSLSEMSDQTLRQVNGVVGFQIDIEEVQAAFKLSQGREKDHERIIEELCKRNRGGDSGIIKHMDKDQP